VNAHDCAAQVFFNRLKRGRQRLAPREDHIIVPLLGGSVGQKPHGFPKPSANAIALHSVADFLCSGEAKPGGPLSLASGYALQAEGARLEPRAPRRRDEIATKLEALRSRTGAAVAIGQREPRE